MEQQLTLDILLNPSVAEIDEERLSRQARDIWSLFKYKQFRLDLKITTGDLADIGKQYGARLQEVRKALVKTGQMIDEVGRDGGTHYYQVVPLDRSTFWKEKVVKKGEEYKWI